MRIAPALFEKKRGRFKKILLWNTIIESRNQIIVEQTMKEIAFTLATSEDRVSIEQLLSESKLPFADVVTHLPHFMVAKQNTKLVGVVGLEILGDVALLRSLAVTNAEQGKGLSKVLYEKILAHAYRQNIKKLYVLTMTAEGYFNKLGFSKIPRDHAPHAIKKTKQFSNLCPGTAICLVKII